MAHDQQINFCLSVREQFPHFFKHSKVLDCGSLDINGNNRFLFKHCNYTGIDICDGPNVEILASVVDYFSLWSNPSRFDVIISTEMLEHDKEWQESLLAMYSGLKKNGLLLITCAGIGRPEHGTIKRSPQDSPATNDYYQNISNDMFSAVLPESLFSTYFLRQFNKDLQFYGIKK